MQPPLTGKKHVVFVNQDGRRKAEGEDTVGNLSYLLLGMCARVTGIWFYPADFDHPVVGGAHLVPFHVTESHGKAYGISRPL